VRQARVADLLSSRPEASQFILTICAGQTAVRVPGSTLLRVRLAKKTVAT
jgi:hypothetical protein